MKKNDSYANWILLGLVSIYILFFSTICFIKYTNFIYLDFDLAEQSQSIWNILHGSVDCSILGVPFLANHMRLILFLIAPVYRFISSPLLLLFLQTVCLGLAAIPLYLIAKKELSPLKALVPCVIYLLYPATAFINLYEFHTEALSVPFLFFMIYFFRENKLTPFLCFSLLTLLCKENLALIVILFGIASIFQKEKKISWAAIPIAVGIIYFLLSTQVIMPYFNQGRMNFYNLYHHLGQTIFSISKTLVLHPIDSFKTTTSSKDFFLLLKLAAPVSFLLFLKPTYLIFCVPIILQHLLSSRPTEHDIIYHYTAPLIPFIFTCVTDALFYLNTKKWVSRITITVLITVALVGNYAVGIPGIIKKTITYAQKKHPATRGKKDLLAKIPPNKSVAATFEFLPSLSSRKELYSFHYILSEKYTLSDKQYHLPTNTDYALINFLDPLINNVFLKKTSPQQIRNFLTEQHLVPLDYSETTALFGKSNESSVSLYAVLPSSPKKKRIVLSPEIGLRDTQVTVSDKKRLQLGFTFESLRHTEKTYWLLLKILKGKKVYYNTFFPICYNIYPTYEWKQGEIININYRINEKLEEGTYLLVGALVDRATNELIFANKKKKEIFIFSQFEIKG